MFKSANYITGEHNVLVQHIEITKTHLLPAVTPELQTQGPALWFDPVPPTWPAPLWAALMM